MPALEALVDDFHAAHTQPVGISVDSGYSHAAWAETLGGISFPLLADFHPKGAVAQSMGVYLEALGITDRATVLIDAAGKVRHVSAVTPAGKRDMAELLAMCREIEAAYDGPTETLPAAPGLEDDAVLYIKAPCTFSRWALSARANLKLVDRLAVKNVSDDEAAREELTARGGKNQAPALWCGGTLRYESDEIIAHLVARVSPNGS